MPREIFSTDAPLSAVGSAAQRTDIEEDFSGAYIQTAGADNVRPKLRMVAGGPAEVDDDDDPVIVRARDSEEDDWFDSARAFDARMEARMDNGHGGSKAPFIRAVDAPALGSIAKNIKTKTYHGPRQSEKNEFRHPGLKKQNKKQIALDLPPTPRGCEWRRSDDGLNLWRCWTEWNDDRTGRIKKSRYAGHLSDDAWRIMKEYDHEAFISTVGERLRRHSGR